MIACEAPAMALDDSSSPYLAPIAEPPRVLDQSYLLGEALGEGGMGSVYRAERRADGRVVALKLVSGPAPLAQKGWAREPWLAIDPKPFLGDRAYDATQHLLNCKARVCAGPRPAIRRFAGLLGVDQDRVRRWLFARAAAEPREEWTEASLDLARALV